MHELSVTESILEIALRHGEQAHAQRITRLNLVIGELSSIVDDSVQFYWDFVAQDTPAAGASLNFRRIPLELNCLNCGHNYHPDETSYTCPKCGTDRFKITSGEEFYLESIEIEN